MNVPRAHRPLLSRWFIVPLALTAILFFSARVDAGWTSVLYDFDPDPAAEFANFINPFNGPTFAPIQMSAQNGIGTGGSDGVEYTPNGNTAGDQEFSVLPLAGGSLAGASDSLQQSLDFRFTHNDSRGQAGMGIGEDDSILLLEVASIGSGVVRVSTLSQDGPVTPAATTLGEPTPSALQNWFRLEMTFTSTGNDVTIQGGLYDLGASGTGTPSLVFGVNTTLTNAGVATGTALSPGAHVFSAQGDAATDVIYLDNFNLVPEPGSLTLAMLGGLLAAGIWLRLRMRRQAIRAG